MGVAAPGQKASGSFSRLGGSYAASSTTAQHAKCQQIQEMLEEAKQTARDQYMMKSNAATQAALFVAPSQTRLAQQLGVHDAKQIARINSSSHLLNVSNGADEVGTLTGKRLEGVPLAPQTSRNLKAAGSTTSLTSSSRSQMILEMKLIPHSPSHQQKMLTTNNSLTCLAATITHKPDQQVVYKKRQSTQGGKKTMAPVRVPSLPSIRTSEPRKHRIQQ